MPPQSTSSRFLFFAFHRNNYGGEKREKIHFYFLHKNRNMCAFGAAKRNGKPGCRTHYTEKIVSKRPTERNKKIQKKSQVLCSANYALHYRVSLWHMNRVLHLQIFHESAVFSSVVFRYFYLTEPSINKGRPVSMPCHLLVYVSFACN